MNVIYDKNAFGKKGFTKVQKKKFEAEQLEKAKEDYKNSNITLKVKYSEGEYDRRVDKLSGFDIDYLNVVVSSSTPTNHAVIASRSKEDKIPFVMISLDQANKKNTFFSSNTFEHEVGHHFLDYVGNSGRIEYLLQEISVNSRLFFQSMGISQQTMREGFAPRRYAVPANPEVNKPRQE